MRGLRGSYCKIGAIPVASLKPLLCPAAVCEYALDAADEPVGVRLTPYEFEYVEYADEFVEAVEFWRNGFPENSEESVCDRRKLLNDITLGICQCCVKCVREQDVFAKVQTCAAACSFLSLEFIGQ